MAWTVLGVRSDAEAARADLRTTRAELDTRSLLEGNAVDDLNTYADRFASIGARLHNPLLAPVRVLPVVGRQLAAATHQTDAAALGMRTVAEIGVELRALVDGGLSSGPRRVETLREVDVTVREGRQALDDLDLGPGDHLVGPLASARDEFDEAQTEVIDALDRVAAMSVGLAAFFEGPSDYLLFAANNAQMQNGQGMFLSAGVLRLEDGRMDLGPVQSIEKQTNVVPPVPLDADLAARWGWLNPNHDLRHLGLSARFPVTARTASELWAALGRPKVDGVVVVDPHVLAAIMRATGPVATPQGERRAEDVIPYTLHDQYQGYLADSSDRSYTDARRDELDDIARTVVDEFENVTDLDPDFLDDFRTTAGGRHLLMWSADPEVQAGFEAAGVDGQISTDSLLLSLVNRSGVKLDWFMQVDSDLSVAKVADGYDVAVDVAVTNDAPPSGEPRYVVGPYPGSGLTKGDYLGLVTLNLPEAAQDSHFDGVDQLAVAGADGPNRTIATWVRVPRGTTTHVVARFHLPSSATVLQIEPSARTHPTTWSFGPKEWTDKERRGVQL